MHVRVGVGVGVGVHMCVRVLVHEVQSECGPCCCSTTGGYHCFKKGAQQLSTCIAAGGGTAISHLDLRGCGLGSVGAAGMLYLNPEP
jgi:hypothetical protein